MLQAVAACKQTTDLSYIPEEGSREVNSISDTQTQEQENTEAQDNSVTPSDQAPKKEPVQYFTFASDANIVLKQNLKPIAEKFNGNIMLGGDASYPFVSDEFKQIMAKANSLKAKKHVYLEGPGGPTGSTGIASDECDRMIARAKKVNITIDRNNCSNGSKWIKKWNDDGWWLSLISEVKYFHKNYGVTSIEVDNLYRAGIESPETVLVFLKDFQAEMKKNNLPVSVLVKNLTVSDLNILAKEINSSKPDRLLRSTLTDFMISEEDFSDQWTSITKAAAKIGIKMLKSQDTNDYQAKGYYK